jgi:hypothetical protein
MNIYARCKVLLPSSGDLTQRKQVDSRSPLAVTLRYFSIIAVQSNICQLAISGDKSSFYYLKLTIWWTFVFTELPPTNAEGKRVSGRDGNPEPRVGGPAGRLTCIPSDHEFTYRLQYCKLVANFRPINHIYASHDSLMWKVLDLLIKFCR